MAKKKSKLDLEAIAQRYGWSLSVLRSNPELKRIFNQAVDKGWEAQRFVAAVRGTHWFKVHSEAARKAAILKKSDPAEWKSRVRAMEAHIRALHVQLVGQKGATSWIKTAARNAVTFGWTDEQINRHIADSLTARRRVKEGTLGGQAGQLEQQLKEAMAAYGIKHSNNWIADRVKQALLGRGSIEMFTNVMQNQAANKYKAFADEIRQGATVKDIADPYIQSMSQILEIPEGSLDVFEPRVQRALTGVDPETNKPSAMPIWQFENHLRQDPRWLRTQNAQDSLLSVGHQVLSSMGLAS